MSEFLFHTTGDKIHGMGHVIRCLVLADEFARRGHSITFFTEQDTPGWTRIQQSGYAMTQAYREADVYVIDIENGPTRLMLEDARPCCARLVIIGGSGYIMQDREAIREWADLFICQTVLPQTVLPTDGDLTCPLTGPEYLMVRPAFAECVPDPNGHILVSMGGGDPHGMTSRIVDALRGLGRSMVVVNGPASSRFLGNSQVFELDAPLSLVPNMDGAALLIGALGMTAFEAAAAGVPSILTAWSKDHADTARELMDVCGCAVSIGMWHEFDMSKMRQYAEDILLDEPTWMLMSAAGKRLVDGYGVVRVADTIERLTNDNA